MRTTVLQSSNQDTLEGKVWLLKQLGHLSEDCNIFSEADAAFKGAVKSYQEFHKELPITLAQNETHTRSFIQTRNGSGQITVDGIFGAQTKQILDHRICGCPDIMDAGGDSNFRRWDFSQFHNRSLSISIPSQMSGLSTSGLIYLWEQALKEVFTYGNDIHWLHGIRHPNIRVSYGPIDGPNNVLAWSYLPSYGSGPSTVLDQRYDTSEPWGQAHGTFLRPVIIHEMLHAMGLPHTNDSTSIMYPSVNGVQHMASWEVDQMYKRYGKPKTDPEPEPDPPSPPKEEVEVLNGQFQINFINPNGEEHTVRLQVIKDKHTP